MVLDFHGFSGVFPAFCLSALMRLNALARFKEFLNLYALMLVNVCYVLVPFEPYVVYEH
jgi:hypothetical protein